MSTMDQLEEPTNDAILQLWYQYASQNSGFVGEHLRLLRDRLGHTIQEQQDLFGTDEDGFVQLQAMPMPRAAYFLHDAQEIAQARGLAHPKSFLDALLLARSIKNIRPIPVLAPNNIDSGMGSQITQNASRRALYQAYQAAFDNAEDLDDITTEND